MPVSLLGTGSWTQEDVLNSGGNAIWFANALQNSQLVAAPPSANAVYNGSLALTRQIPTQANISGEIYYAKMRMTTNFASTAVTGDFGEFVRVDATQSNPVGIPTSSVSGAIPFSGTVSGTSLDVPSLFGSVNGNFVSGDMSGDFFIETTTGRKVASGFSSILFSGDTDDSLGTFIASE